MKAEKSKKLIDILSEENSTQELKLQVEDSKINTDSEINAVKKDINKQEKEINTILREVDFSASKLYNARLRLTLLNNKLEGLTNISSELF